MSVEEAEKIEQALESAAQMAGGTGKRVKAPKPPKEVDPAQANEMDLIKDSKKEMTKVKGWETNMQLKHGKLYALDSRYVAKQLYKDMDKVLGGISSLSAWILEKVNTFTHMAAANVDDTMLPGVQAKVFEVEQLMNDLNKRLKDIKV